MTEKHTETARKLNISEAAEASARTQLKSAEAAVRGLKDEMARVKTLVSQTRASCATEVRRRDRQIDGLKRQLGEATRSRGSARNPAISVISVTGEVGAGRSAAAGAKSTGDAAYDLRDETNEFLTELAKGLSEENEGLLALLRRMREELKVMSGWARETAEGDGHAVDMTTNVSELESDLTAILEHLRTILTNPSFVPLEEVVERDEEISHLREGWVKMESRWKEAVHLIDGWRKRMATSGMAVNDEELKLSLRLSPVRGKGVAETEQALGLRLPCLKEEDEEDEEEEEECAGVGSPSPTEHHDSVDLVSGPAEDDLPDCDSESSAYHEHEGGEQDAEMEDSNVEILQQSESIEEPRHPPVDSSPLPEPPQLSPLKDSNSAGNRRASHSPKPRQRTARGHTTVVEEDTREYVEETRESHVTKWRTHSRPATTSQSKRQKVERIQEDMNSSVSSLDSILLDTPSKRTSQKPAKPAPAPKTMPSTSAKRSVPPSSSRRTKPAPPPEPSGELTVEMPAEQAPSEPAFPVKQQSPKRTTRPSIPRPSGLGPQQSPLTMDAIAAKLAASERDADAARVRAKLKAARMAKRRPELAPREVEAAPADENGGDVDPVKKDIEMEGQDAREEREEVPVKRKREKRASRVASRRRSTLSPWELESLISGKPPAEAE